MNDASDITVLLLPDDKKLYLEMESFIRFLRDSKSDRPSDAAFQAGLVAIADFLDEKKVELLQQRETLAEVFVDKKTLN